MQKEEIIETATVRVVHASWAYRFPNNNYRMVMDYPYLLVEDGQLKRDEGKR